MRELDRLFDVFRVATLGPGSIKFMGPAMSDPKTVRHIGILRGEEVWYYTDPTEDPEGEVSHILFPYKDN